MTAGLPEQETAGEAQAGAAGPGAEAARVRDLRNRLIVALVFFIPLSDLSVLWSLFPWSRFPGWQWILLVTAAPVVIWSAWPFHAAALRNARTGARYVRTCRTAPRYRFMAFMDLAPPRPGLLGSKKAAAPSRLSFTTCRWKDSAGSWRPSLRRWPSGPWSWKTVPP